eukprot:scaffold78951_cov60-Phaeocystis_antarctica.AAC.1
MCAADWPGGDRAKRGGRAGGRRVVVRIQRHDRARASAERVGRRGGAGRGRRCGAPLSPSRLPVDRAGPPAAATSAAGSLGLRGPLPFARGRPAARAGGRPRRARAHRRPWRGVPGDGARSMLRRGPSLCGGRGAARRVLPAAAGAGGGGCDVGGVRAARRRRVRGAQRRWRGGGGGALQRAVGFGGRGGVAAARAGGSAGALGPAFRTLETVWEGDGEATARLRRRALLAGTQVHPADLDGAIQLLISSSKSESGGLETRLPFAVDGVLMRGPAVGVLWAVASASGANAADAVLGSGDGAGKAKLDGFRVRVLSSAATTARRHIYQTAWHEAPGDSSAGAGAILLLGSSSDSAVLRLDSAPQALLANERPVIVVAATESLLPLPALVLALQLVSSMMGSQAAPPTVWLLSVSLAVSSARSAVGVATAGSWGLARAARAELPGLPLGCASNDALAPVSWPWMLTVGGAPPGEPEVEWSGNGFKVPRLARGMIEAEGSGPKAGSG